MCETQIVMLPKLERLKEKKLFNLAFRKKRRLSSNLVHLYYLFKKDINKLNEKKIPPKTAFIVGLKIDKRATRRNLIKRRMREAYTIIKKKAIHNNDRFFSISVLIWIANPEIKNATFGEIEEKMKKLLNGLII